MAEKKVVAFAKKKKPSELAEGLHPAEILRTDGTGFRVRTLAGVELAAAVDPRVETLLVEECMRERRLVLLTRTVDGPAIVGALQTTRTLGYDADGALDIDGNDVVVSARRSLKLACGDAVLVLDPGGAMRIEGTRLSVDVSSLVRFLTARLELP